MWSSWRSKYLTSKAILQFDHLSFNYHFFCSRWRSVGPGWCGIGNLYKKKHKINYCKVQFNLLSDNLKKSNLQKIQHKEPIAILHVEHYIASTFTSIMIRICHYPFNSYENKLWEQSFYFINSVLSLSYKLRGN
jgi:hypothetical protein